MGPKVSCVPWGPAEGGLITPPSPHVQPPAVPCPPRPAGGPGRWPGSRLRFWVGLSVRKKDTEAG